MVLAQRYDLDLVFKILSVGFMIAVIGHSGEMYGTIIFVIYCSHTGHSYPLHFAIMFILYKIRARFL